jgi:UDP-N-acetylmuramate--alanine ligase
VNSALIAKHIAPNRVRLEPSMLKMVDLVVAESRKGDVIITMGAGDISALAPVIVDALQL